MQEHAADKPWHISDVAIGEPPDATPEYGVRRRIGAALRQLGTQMIRADLSGDVLARVADALEALVVQTAGVKRRSQKGIYGRLLNGSASRQDVLDILDYELFTGLSTPISPPMQLWIDGDCVRGRAKLDVTFQGPPGRVHGGIIAAMLDVLMAKTQDITGTVGVTGTLNIRYLKGTPLGTDIDMEARILRREGRKLFCEGRFFVDGEQTVHAEGIWITMQEWR